MWWAVECYVRQESGVQELLFGRSWFFLSWYLEQTDKISKTRVCKWVAFEMLCLRSCTFFAIYWTPIWLAHQLNRTSHPYQQSPSAWLHVTQTSGTAWSQRSIPMAIVEQLDLGIELNFNGHHNTQAPTGSWSEHEPPVRSWSPARQARRRRGHPTRSWRHKKLKQLQ